METNEKMNAQPETPTRAEEQVPSGTTPASEQAQQEDTPHRHPHTNALLAASLGHSAVNHVRPRHSTRLEH